MMLLNPYISFPSAGGGGSLPAGATAQIDFVNGFYYAGGSLRTVGAVLGDGPDTATAGGGFDAGQISGLGMYVDNTNVNRPNAIGPLASDIAAGLAAGCTIVFEIDFRSTPSGSFIWILSGTRSNNSGAGYASAYVFGDVQVENQGAIDVTGGNPGFSGTTGIKRIAVTFARHTSGVYEYAGSTEGTAATTQNDTPAPFSPVNNITLFHDGRDTQVLDDAYVRSMTLYPAKLPGDLAALTA
jgi:hypothetical protein